MDLLTFDEGSFNQKAREFHNLSEKLNDNWKMNETNGKLYLSKRTIVSIKSKQQPEPVIESLDTDDLSAATHNETEVICVEYQCLFHPSYQVPVLYFNAYTDSSLISLDDIPRIFVNEFENEDSQDEIQDIITQAEHPILFKPFFMIHPCKVNEVLSKFPSSKNFVLTFLTIYGPSVRLKMNPEYEKLF